MTISSKEMTIRCRLAMLNIMRRAELLYCRRGSECNCKVVSSQELGSQRQAAEGNNGVKRLSNIASLANPKLHAPNLLLPLSTLGEHKSKAQW